MSILYETVLSKLGSRIHLHFIPQQKKLFYSPAGIICEKLLNLSIGVVYDNKVKSSPFTEKFDNFDFVEQDISLTSVCFKAKDVSSGLYVELKFTSPFYPKDEKLSTAPFFYLEVKINKLVSKNRDNKTLTGEFFIQLDAEPKDKLSLIKNGILLKKSYSCNYKLNTCSGLVDKIEDSDSDIKIDGELVIVGFKKVRKQKVKENSYVINLPFKVDNKKGWSAKFVIAGYSKDVVLETKGGKYKLLYGKFFDNINSVVNYAKNSVKKILTKNNFFESLFLESSLSKTKLNFLSFSFQTYLANTWWGYDSHSEWFSVLEGNCNYHSTVDVEYNIALIYLLLWPELLEKEICQWSKYVKKNVVSHDIGALFEAKSMAYPHDMEVEENCNFILLLYVLWRFTGKDELIKNYYKLVKRLIEFVIKSDTTGNGFPDRGTANTVDDASPAVQFAKEQTYLGVKALSTYHAVYVIAEKMNDIKLKQKCLQMIKKINFTLEKKAWLKDHYIVSLNKKVDNIIDPWSKKVITGVLEGWDAYSIYTSNGLLYLLLTNTEIDINYEKIKTDIYNSYKNTLIEYGCTHTSVDKSNIWISQNLWRDFVAAYLGIDLLDLTDRYWQFELFENTQGRGGCFVDTYGWNHLHYYLRGITSIGLFFALAGIKIDVVKKTIVVSPVRIPVKIPLLTFADWEKMRVPWIEISLVDKKINVEIKNNNLIKNYKVVIE